MLSELKPFRIGPLQVGFPVFLAPMAGYTDLAYRLICRTHGTEYCVTEMMLDRLLLLHGKLRSRMFQMDALDHPVGAQLMGNDPDVMAEATRIVFQMGFDAVDLNFACPVHKALSRKRGGFLMETPDLAVRIVKAVVAAAEGRPVTVKTRRSFRLADRECEAFWRIAEGAFEAGVAALCVHGRSVEQKYAGPADWPFIAAVKQRYADRTIIGSGDILKPHDAVDMIERTGVDGVIVARGALGNPWFFSQVKDVLAGREPYHPTLQEQRELLMYHFGRVCELYGERRGPKIMRGWGIKYARLHPTPGKARSAFVAVKKADDWRAVVDQFYGG